MRLQLPNLSHQSEPMHSLIFSGAEPASPKWLNRTSLAARNSEKDENWLQQTLFSHPELIPIREINPGASGFVPICRELTIPKAGGSVFLDIFGVTPEGKLVLVECKLWRNPQARREVVAQILEYAALVRQWSFGDLTARVKSRTKSEAANPIFEVVSSYHPELDEGRFVDAVDASLRTGDFVLIIAGDGIRSDIHAIADHLNQSSGLTSRIALVEFQLWENDRNDLVIVPSVPLRTEVVQHRIFVTDDGRPISFEMAANSDDETEAIVDPSRNASKSAEKAFWQAFIDQAEYDHPDQPKPRHGGHGWVRMAMPEPAGWMTAFRTKEGRGGLFIRFKGDEGEQAVAEIGAAKAQLEDDIGHQLNIETKNQHPYEAVVSINFAGPAGDDASFLAWLLRTSNAVSMTFRPFLSQLATN